MTTRALTVTEFLHGVNDVLASVPALVEGELTGYSVSQGKWAFFSLKDDASVVGCFMPVWKLRHAVEDGMSVRVAGVPRVYERSGKFSIVVEALEPAGEGSLKRAFELLKAKLEGEGLFAPARKRAIPRFPERIGLIASGESAAYSDFLQILRNRWGGVSVLHADVPVQGMSAVPAIVDAFRYFAEQHGSAQDACAIPDVVVLTRGGGSLEDLQSFNSEEVARAIFASPIPVVVGVGHERDVTIADLVADVRASTPSNAAERAVPDRRDVANELRACTLRMTTSARAAVASRRMATVRFVSHGATFVHARRMRVSACTSLISGRVIGYASALRERVVAAARLVENLNPQRLLARGYTMTLVRGVVVRSARRLQDGDVLTTRFSDGEVASVVRP